MDYIIPVTSFWVSVGDNLSASDDSSPEWSIIACRKVTSSSKFQHAEKGLDSTSIDSEWTDEMIWICWGEPLTEIK